MFYKSWHWFKRHWILGHDKKLHVILCVYTTFVKYFGNLFVKYIFIGKELLVLYQPCNKHIIMTRRSNLCPVHMLRDAWWECGEQGLQGRGVPGTDLLGRAWNQLITGCSCYFFKSAFKSTTLRLKYLTILLYSTFFFTDLYKSKLFLNKKSFHGVIEYGSQLPGWLYHSWQTGPVFYMRWLLAELYMLGFQGRCSHGPAEVTTVEGSGW